MASWHEAERMQRRNFHVQQSLTDDLPVLIPAPNLPVADLTPRSCATFSEDGGARGDRQTLPTTNGGGRASIPAQAPSSSQEPS